jgi:two-component system NtrC family response regulator
VVLARGDAITVDELPETLRRQTPPVESLRLDLPPEGISLDGLERELILLALKRFDGNQTQAAKYLDISRKTLIYRIEKHGLNKL